MEYKELATSKYLCFYSSLTENSRRNWQIPRSKWVSKCKYTSDVISLKNVCVLAHMHECMVTKMLVVIYSGYIAFMFFLYVSILYSKHVTCK